jgi:GNAT superfamily N-acetyltransferase
MRSAVDQLDQHLKSWLGEWPAPGPGVRIVATPARDRPGWDGQVHPVIGVIDAEGVGVMSVGPAHAESVRALSGGPVDTVLAGLPAALGRPRARAYRGVFRWTFDPAPLPDAGTWVPADAPVVPGWLRVFGGDVLLALDPRTGEYLAGVGIKRHDQFGHELSVGTAEAARGRGLARRLVAQAARFVVDNGRVATYLHDPANTASAKVADAAGFPDRGWSIVGIG